MKLLLLSPIIYIASAQWLAADEQISTATEVTFAVRLFEKAAALPDQKSQMNFVEMTWAGSRDISAGQSLLWDLQVGTNGTPYLDPEVAKLKLSDGRLSLSFGIDTLYWAKTETAQLSNIINQEDLSRGRELADQLGRAMLQLSYFSEIGRFDAFYLPHAREKAFPTADSRLRTQRPIIAKAKYQDPRGIWTPSAAIRYSHWLGPFDVGLYSYHGVAHEPAFIPTPDGLAPFYATVTHTGADLQYTRGQLALKSDLRYTRKQSNRKVEQVDVRAIAVGLEYTIYGVAKSDIDLILIGEYAYDSRGHLAVSPYQNDLIAGGRLQWNTINASRVELFYFDDLDLNTKGLSIELAHRVQENLTLLLAGQVFFDVDPNDVLFGVEGDNNLRLSFTLAF